MINSIIDAISMALNAEFGDSYDIHMEEIEQGLKEPCFFILCLNPTSRRFLKGRYFRVSQFCIQYFPETREKRRECYRVAERLLSCLEYIALEGDAVMGTRMHYEVVDGVLHFFVDYDMFVDRKPGEIPVMGEVSQETLVKG